MKKQCILLSLFLFLLVINIPFVIATSETISLTPDLWQSITRNVELQMNDRLVGSFTVSNLQIWQNGFGDNQTHSVSVTVLDPKGQVVLSYASTAGDSFDYTAFYSGVYTIQFTCGFEYSPPSGIENPEITLNYNVVSAVQQTPTAQIQTPTPYQPESPNQFQTQTQQPNLLSSGTSMNPRILVVIVAAVIICIGVAVIAILTKTGRLNSRGKQVEVLQR
jgi:hypothetical protein